MVSGNESNISTTNYKQFFCHADQITIYKCLERTGTIYSWKCISIKF